MNDIGWLFLFMSDFENNLVLKALRSPSGSSPRSEKRVESLAPLPVEQIEALGEFFELIAKWDEENSCGGN
jgi:hypothetical protein